MISAVELYDDVNFQINKENGYLSYADFTAVSWLAQLNMLDWLSGGLDNVNPPEEISPQKRKDWLSVFIVKKPAQVTGGTLARPADYYLFLNLYKLNGRKVVDDYEEYEYVSDNPIELLDAPKFNNRLTTFIEELKPKVKPVAKLTNVFEFEPKDIGSVILEYVRYPAKARIIGEPNDTYKDEDPSQVIDFEWGEYARPLLIFFIADQFFNRTREQSGKTFNQSSKQLMK